MPDVRITEFTDPACPWAFSAEPFKLRLRWLYGDSIEWVPRMVVLSESTDAMTVKGFTPSKLAGAFATIAADHGMPIDTSERPRLTISAPACRAVVAARESGADAEGLLRALRVRNFDGELFDEPEVIAAAAADAGVDLDVLDTDVDAALAADMHAARHPTQAASVLDARLADWEGGRRYTCPSYEIERLSDGAAMSVPGFQPFRVYEVVLANLLPGVERRETPDSVEEVLRWAPFPLATREIAEICELSDEEAREALGAVANERASGADGYWALTSRRLPVSTS